LMHATAELAGTVMRTLYRNLGAGDAWRRSLSLVVCGFTVTCVLVGTDAAGQDQSGQELAQVRLQIATERAARDAARHEMEEAHKQLEEAERAGGRLREQLAAERSAREAAEVVAQHAHQQLAKERSGKETAEHKMRQRPRFLVRRVTWF
jgi:hypothetical protein